MAYVDTETINDIKNRTDIVEVISRYVPLTKRGNNYFGLCPFHDDHNPSMSVSPDKQMFKCFVCEKAGNVFNFVSLYEHVPFNEAVILLSNKLGYKLDATYKSNNSNKYNSYYEINNLAVKFYQNNLHSSLGKNAMEYLTNRKLSKETIKKFDIGLSISRMPVTDFLLKKNYKLDKLIDIGLSNTMSNDIFVDRIMVPLHDLNGNVVGFSGRIYQTNDDRKYINSKESDIFKKNNLLYNYHRAHEKLKKDDSIIIMEGFFDVIRADTVGVTNCVATMGTALTKQHINQLKKITDNIILCFDGDKAGENATIRAIPLLEECGINPKIIRLEEKDPDEYIIKRGKDAFISKIENPISAMDFKMKILKSDKDMSNVSDVSKYIEQSLQELTKLESSIEIELILNKLSFEYKIDYQILKNKFDIYDNKIKNNINSKKVEVKLDKRKYSQYYIAINNLIFYMLRSDKVIDYVIENVIYVTDDLYRILYNEIIYFYQKYGTFKEADFFTYISDNNDVSDLLAKITTMNMKDEYYDEEIINYVEVVNKEVKKVKIKELEKELKDETDPMVQLKILNEINNIKGVNSNDRSN